MPKLTDLFIEKAPLSKARATHWDSLLPAFGLRCGARTKSFIYVDSSGSRKTLGHYPAMTLKSARDAARALMQNTGAHDTRILLSEAIRAYLEAITVRPNTQKFYAWNLSQFAKKYGHLQLAAVTPRMCAEAVQTPQMHITCKVFFTWCRRQAILEKDPMELLGAPKKVNQRTRILTDEELKKVWTSSKQLKEFGLIVRLCILTGQRRGELSLIQPQWYSDTMLTFPSSVTKNKRDHSIPLTNNSLTHLKQLTKLCRAWSKPKVKLDQISGVTAYCLHDLRRTYRSTMGRIGVAPHIAERLVNHVSSQSDMERIYDHYKYEPEMREAQERYEKHLETVIGEPLI